MKKDGTIRVKRNSIELRTYVNGVQKSFCGKTEAEARRKAREYKKNAGNIKEDQLSKDILYNYLSDWLVKYKYGKIKDSSYDILERVLQNQIQETELAKKRLKDITVDDMQNFLNDLAAKYSQSIVGKAIEILKPSIKKAVIENKMRYNPLDFITMPGSDEVSHNHIVSIEMDDEYKQIYTNEEIQKITDCCMDYYGKSTRNNKRYRYAPAYVLLLNTGMRIGEFAALTWRDINFANRTIKISKTVALVKNRNRFDSNLKKVNIITDSKTKNSKRVIPMNETAEYVLRELKIRQMNEGIKSPFVVSNPKGEAMYVRVFEQTFDRICEENGIPNKGLHALRHTFGSILIRKGVDIKVVSEILGHSTVQFTYDKYIHIIKEMKAQAVNLICVSSVCQQACAN